MKKIVMLAALVTWLGYMTSSSAAPPESAGDLQGVVTTTDGRPIEGAMVTAINADATHRITVYTGASGNYRISTSFAGEIQLRVRTPYFGDVTRSVSLDDDAAAPADFVLDKLAAPADLSASLAASAHAATLDWQDPGIRDAFVSQCHFCHQIGNEFTRRPRPLDAWTEVVDRMEGYLVLLTNKEKRAIRDTLNRDFTGEPVTAVQTYDVSAELHRARIDEWVAGDGMSFIHDADVGADGRLYGVDEGHDLIWILDRDSGAVEKVSLPDSGLPVGGLFSGLALPVGIFTGKHGPHSMAQGADGRFWITNALSATLMSFDPASRRFAVYPVGGDALYPHTIRIDGEGIVWFTLAVSKQVARFDPGTETFTLIDLPSNGVARWLADAFLPMILKISAWFPRKNLHLTLSHHKWTGEGKEVLNMPYGIDINPVDGSVWYAKLYADRIGRIDPDSFEITEIETPLHGPRRPRFDPDGVLWIPSFDDGAILRFDPSTNEFKSYPLPRLAPNEYETPYALNVHPDTGDIWITSNTSDRIFRFSPDSETFISYPSPTRVTFLRDLVFTDDGKVCSSHSNLPAYAIEGGVPAFICLDPDGAVDQ
jgi:streptogramin lyase